MNSAALSIGRRFGYRTAVQNFASYWDLDPSVTFLNHGSFGACPQPVLAYQQEIRARMERQPVRFFSREAPRLLDEARQILGAFIGADPGGLAFVPNATAGVNTVLQSLALGPKDELLLTDHGYNACNNAARFVAERSGAQVVFAEPPFPLRDPKQVVDAVLEKVTPRTKLALIDHVTSPTGLVFPIEAIVQALNARGVLTLVDGAHAPGMLELQVDRLSPDYYTGNCHKWLCTPKGSAFLWARADRRESLRPLTISHGANAIPPGSTRFRAEFDWPGTTDWSSYLSIPRAIEFFGGLLPGGWPELRSTLKQKALTGRRILLESMDALAPAPEVMIGSLAAIPLPGLGQQGPGPMDALYETLVAQGFEVPVFRWKGRILRISAQLYNTEDQYRALAKAVTAALAAGG